MFVDINTNICNGCKLAPLTSVVTDTFCPPLVMVTYFQRIATSFLVVVTINWNKDTNLLADPHFTSCFLQLKWAQTWTCIEYASSPFHLSTVEKSHSSPGWYFGPAVFSWLCLLLSTPFQSHIRESVCGMWPNIPYIRKPTGAGRIDRVRNEGWETAHCSLFHCGLSLEDISLFRLVWVGSCSHDRGKCYSCSVTMRCREHFMGLSAFTGLSLLWLWGPQTDS